MYTSVTAYHSNNQADFGLVRTLDVNANVVNLYNQHTFTLPHKWNIEVSAYYTFPSIWGGTFLNCRYWGSTVGASHKIWKDRGLLVVSVTDPFNSQQWRGISQFGGLYMDASGGYDSRQIRANFTYTFDSSQVKGARQRNAGADEENKRIK